MAFTPRGRGGGGDRGGFRGGRGGGTPRGGRGGSRGPASNGLQPNRNHTNNSQEGSAIVVAIVEVGVAVEAGVERLEGVGEADGEEHHEAAEEDSAQREA